MHSNRIFVGFLAILLLFSSLSSRSLQQAGDIFFEEEGVWVRGEFAAFYNTAPDAQRLFGNAFTEAMDDPLRPGIQVQYFERARMDLDPTRPPGQRVSLANLGENLRDESQPGQPIDFSTNSNLCRAFNSGRLVCYNFLKMYDSHNGPVYFGQPITDTEIEDGLLVQYFERARMEWHPDRPAGERVTLTELGRIDYTLRIGGFSAPEGYLRELTAYAFVEKPVVAEGEEQWVHFVVYDQRGNPVPDANVIYDIIYPGGGSNAIRVENLTNADGFTSTKFRVTDVEPNTMITIKATVSLDIGLSTTTTTWFRVWW